MIRLLTAPEAKEADRRTIRAGMPSPVLMERAALSVIHAMIHARMPLDRVLVLAGTGNNGGDGIAVARMLCERGFHPAVLLTGSREKFSPELEKQLELLSWYDVTFVQAYEAGRYTVVVDAIFGVGLSRDIRPGSIYDVIAAVNADPDARVVAVDIPSGIHADTGSVCGIALRAERTVSFAFGKPGLYLTPGAAYAGTVQIAGIGIPEAAADGTAQKRYLLQRQDLPMLPERDPFGNKGTFGKILVIAGSADIFGAAYLAGRAALKAGAGMVRILTEASNRTPLTASFPEALISTWETGMSDPAPYAPLLNWADAVLIGPGLGTGMEAQLLLEWVLRSAACPVVLDADALNLLAGHADLMQLLHRNCTLTPHLMEMSRLTGMTIEELRSDLFAAAESFSARTGSICVLKDARTVIAYPDRSSFLVAEGSDALATAGSGDVLSGIIAALTAQQTDPSQRAAAVGDLVHALAGSAAAERLSARTVTAGDVLDSLSEVF